MNDYMPLRKITYNHRVSLALFGVRIVKENGRAICTSVLYAFSEFYVCVSFRTDGNVFYLATDKLFEMKYIIESLLREVFFFSAA